jgi:hypothetical protein
MGYSSGSCNYFIDVDLQKQIFRMSTQVFRGSATLPKSIAEYFAALSTQRAALALDKQKVVILTEEIPFAWGPQPTLRQQFYRFLRRAQQCRHLLGRLAHIERRSDVEDMLES